MAENECFKKCKVELSRYYSLLPGLISRSENQIERLKLAGAPIDIGTIDYSKPKVDGGKRNDAETDCENLIAEMAKLNKLKSEQACTEEILNMLSSEQRELLEMIFKKKMTQEEIAERINFERTTVARRFKKAVCNYAYFKYGDGDG